MTNKMIQRTALATGLVALLALQACGTSTVSKRISDEGVAGEVVFPAQKDAWFREGTFPNLDNLRRIAPGVTKDQLYDFVGRPHFSEGMGAVREWDYIFHFRTPTGVKTCQYKAIFDKNVVAQTFHWLPTDCADVLKSAAAAAAPVPALAARPAPQRMELSADALFAFDGARQDDLLPAGRGELDALAASLRNAKSIERIDITGHTDRLGSPPYNQQLSMARAATVRDYLVKAGVPARGIQVRGLGETQPKVQCAQADRRALIACLAPNRRVDISVQSAS
ncbi:OmpA family protein [Variovorax sp. ZT4R33]|uniref:OmpA family protein n=1 Tax=Variovorax sp. ZT4R33 TaxID=3443743 RepID=UPI003F45E4A1